MGTASNIGLDLIKKASGTKPGVAKFRPLETDQFQVAGQAGDFNVDNFSKAMAIALQSSQGRRNQFGQALEQVNPGAAGLTQSTTSTIQSALDSGGIPKATTNLLRRNYGNQAATQGFAGGMGATVAGLGMRDASMAGLQAFSGLSQQQQQLDRQTSLGLTTDPMTAAPYALINPEQSINRAIEIEGYNNRGTTNYEQQKLNMEAAGDPYSKALLKAKAYDVGQASVNSSAPSNQYAQPKDPSFLEKHGPTLARVGKEVYNNWPKKTGGQAGGQGGYGVPGGQIGPPEAPYGVPGGRIGPPQAPGGGGRAGTGGSNIVSSQGGPAYGQATVNALGNLASGGDPASVGIGWLNDAFGGQQRDPMVMNASGGGGGGGGSTAGNVAGDIFMDYVLPALVNEAGGGGGGQQQRQRPADNRNWLEKAVPYAIDAFGGKEAGNLYRDVSSEFQGGGDGGGPAGGYGHSPGEIPSQDDILQGLGSDGLIDYDSESDAERGARLAAPFVQDYIKDQILKEGGKFVGDQLVDRFGQEIGETMLSQAGTAFASSAGGALVANAIPVIGQLYSAYKIGEAIYDWYSGPDKVYAPSTNNRVGYDPDKHEWFVKTIDADSGGDNLFVSKDMNEVVASYQQALRDGI